jgi:hypothetical protein
MNSMAKSSILPTKHTDIEIDIFSNKSSMILFWLLIQHKRAKTSGFSINELSRQTSLSLGLVHKVVKQLEYNGIIVSKGFRTSKVFYLKSSNQLLIEWVKHYSLIKKTKTLGFAYGDAISSVDEKKYGLIPALHLASEKLYGSKGTNLKTREYYLSDWTIVPKLVEKFALQEMDRGYELLLIKPYYSALIEKVTVNSSVTWEHSYALLTVLDLCHFPIRGVEQAERLYRKLPYLNSIATWIEVENAIG